MAVYSIFIDESGNFDDLNNLSLVAGFITTKTAKEVDEIVNDLFLYLSEKYEVKDRLIHHLTQLKRQKREEAFEIVEELLVKVEDYKFSYFLMTNQLNIKIEDPDDTYLNMLCDAMANIILNIHAKDSFAEFKIYPAIKKRNSVVERRLSFNEERKLDFDEIFIKEYSGLVTEKIKALFLQIGQDMPKVEVILKNARHFAPLFLSDYLCNTIYNREKEPSKTIFESHIQPRLDFNFMFSLTTIRNQIDTSLFNGNLYNAIFMLLKAYEGVEEVGETEEERVLILESLDRLEQFLIDYFSNREFEDRLGWAITYILKNIELQSKKDKNHKRALLWYRKLINLVSSIPFESMKKLKFSILVDKLSLLNRSGYLINHTQLIGKIENMIPEVLNSTDIIQRVIHFYNVAAVSHLSMYQFDNAFIYIDKSLKYLSHLSNRLPEFLEGFAYEKIQIPEYGKALGTAGRNNSLRNVFLTDNDENTEINYFDMALEHLKSSESKLRCLSYMVYEEIINKNGEKAYLLLKEMGKLVDFDDKSDFVDSYFYRKKPLPVLMLLLFLNTDFHDKEIYKKQQKMAEQVINKTDYFSEFVVFFYPFSSVLREWILFRFNYFSLDESITFHALYQFLKFENYHIFPQLIILKLSIYTTEIYISNDEQRLKEILKDVVDDLKILIESDSEKSMEKHFQPILNEFIDIDSNFEVKKLKENAKLLKSIIFI